MEAKVHVGNGFSGNDGTAETKHCHHIDGNGNSNKLHAEHYASINTGEARAASAGQQQQEERNVIKPGGELLSQHCFWHSMSSPIYP